MDEHLYSPRSEQTEFWRPPSIEPVLDPEQPTRAFLHFPDIPQGEEHDLQVLVASRFFTHFAFELWNASQTGLTYLTRQIDVTERGIWLYADPDSPASLHEQVRDLVRRYDEARDTEDAYTKHRIAYVVTYLQKLLASYVPKPE